MRIVSLLPSATEMVAAVGVAAALLFSLYLVGRLVVGSAVLNVTLDVRRTER